MLAQTIDFYLDAVKIFGNGSPFYQRAEVESFQLKWSKHAIMYGIAKPMQNLWPP